MFRETADLSTRSGVCRVPMERLRSLMLCSVFELVLMTDTGGILIELVCLACDYENSEQREAAESFKYTQLDFFLLLCQFEPRLFLQKLIGVRLL